jgi:hypothetical protein
MKRILIAGLLALASLSPSLAQSWTEQRFDPAVGSRWVLQVESNSEDTRPDGTMTMQIRSRADMTIEEKTSEGFRITYTHRDVQIDGSNPAARIMASAFEALQGVVVRGVLDAGGKPARVENLAELQAAMRIVVDRTVATVKEPRLQGVIRQIMSAMLLTDNPAAANIYMSELQGLALGQNTGLQPGEVRRWTESVSNPAGGGSLSSANTLRIAQTDAQSGKVRFALTRSADPESVKELGLNLVKQMGVAIDKPLPPKLVEIMKSMAFSLETETDIDVEHGMTRSLNEQTTMSTTTMGQTMTKRERKTVTLSPAP